MSASRWPWLRRSVWKAVKASSGNFWTVVNCIWFDPRCLRRPPAGGPRRTYHKGPFQCLLAVSLRFIFGPHRSQPRSAKLFSIGTGSSYAERHERFPEGTDARAAVLAMNDDGGWPPGWASSYSSACPDSFLRDKSIGYVYVGSGLPARAATEQPALVFFCPSGNHQRSEHRCFVVMADGMRYLRSNADMVRLLRAELGRARTGAVGYSAGAQEQMSRELAARVEYEKKRKPNQAAAPNRRPFRSSLSANSCPLFPFHLTPRRR